MATGEKSSEALSSSLTDLMTSLAIIFILLLVIFLKQASDQSKRAKMAVRAELVELLKDKNLEMVQNLSDPLTISVQLGEDILNFAVGSHTLSAKGQKFVQNFFRPFAVKICQSDLRNQIDSIVIEGHTDKSGENRPGGVQRNIALSQRRSFTVLSEGLESVASGPTIYECLLKLASATGQGSRSPVLTDGTYDSDKSRRVEIKIRVRSAEQKFKELQQGF